MVGESDAVEGLIGEASDGAEAVSVDVVEPGDVGEVGWQCVGALDDESEHG